MLSANQIQHDSKASLNYDQPTRKQGHSNRQVRDKKKMQAMSAFFFFFSQFIFMFVLHHILH